MKHKEARKYWAGLIKECENSGQVVRTFCRKKCIAKSAFYRWRKKFDSEALSKSASGEIEATAGFTELSIVEDKRMDSSLQIELVNGIKITTNSSFDEGLFKRVVGVLNQC